MVAAKRNRYRTSRFGDLGNARARSFLSRYLRCNVCIVTGTHVYVRFCDADHQPSAESQ
jgi:hypothetical protein